jgi:hypothetical protein
MVSLLHVDAHRHSADRRGASEGSHGGSGVVRPIVLDRTMHSSGAAGLLVARDQR